MWVRRRGAGMMEACVTVRVLILVLRQMQTQCNQNRRAYGHFPQPRQYPHHRQKLVTHTHAYCRESWSVYGGAGGCAVVVYEREFRSKTVLGECACPLPNADPRYRRTDPAQAMRTAQSHTRHMWTATTCGACTCACTVCSQPITGQSKGFLSRATARLAGVKLESDLLPLWSSCLIYLDVEIKMSPL